ncbi:MAG: DUF1552 domain-containing protein [Pirellula sp.]
MATSGLDASSRLQGPASPSANSQPHDSEITWLTAARKPGVVGFCNSISIDQMVANHFGIPTRFASVTLTTA